jgi:hypothetical protein
VHPHPVPRLHRRPAGAGKDLPVKRSHVGLAAAIGAVLLASLAALLFGPARGARDDIGHVRKDLAASRTGIYQTLDTGRASLADADRTLRATETSLQVQQQGLAISSQALQTAQGTGQDVAAIRSQTDAALATVRQVIAALGPLQTLKGDVETVVTLARTALGVAQQTLATGQQALEVARTTLATLRQSRDIQQQLLDVARSTLQQTQEINRKIPLPPVFGAATPSP